MRRPGRSSGKSCMRIVLKKTISQEGPSAVSPTLLVDPRPTPLEKRTNPGSRPVDFSSSDGLRVGSSLASRRERKKQPFKRGLAAFTMVEIAISLGVIAIALVAILGVLPTGVRVQKDNREDTILNQEGEFWLEAIRSGSRGLNYLTNYVDLIKLR